MRILPGSGWSVFRCTIIAILSLSVVSAWGDANSWLKPTSGNWEEPQWSQGMLPNSGHSVMITNAGWKAVQIAPSTVQNFPNSLTVYSITVASPVDSYNTLLLNSTGFGRPLTANYSILIGSGAAMTMNSSALRLAGPTGVGLSVAGEFNQNEYSEVIGNQVDVGWDGPGVYNLNTGLLQLQHLFVGGRYPGVFNHNAGSNSPGILHLRTGGTYNLRKGVFNGTTYTDAGSVFRQDGGRVYSHLEFHGGQYILNNGMNYGGVTLSVYGDYRRGSASAIQNGGTNLGPIYLGGDNGSGSYTLSNGVVQAPVLALDMGGGFSQNGGTVTTPGAITLSWGYYDRGLAIGSGYALNGGFLSSTGISMEISSFSQNGGTNQIAGGLQLISPGWYGRTSYGLHGGLLVTENTSLGASTSGGFFQSGGTHRVANTVGISGPLSWGSWDWRGYEMSGGQLITSNLSLMPGAIFRQTGGTIAQSGITTLNAASLFPGPGTQQLGRLQLSGTNGLTMPSKASSIVRFRNSTAFTWDSTASLMIDNWSGSPAGGGSQRIIFGQSSAALTPQQLTKISFRYPAGFAWGMYSAKILSSGEIVPDGLPPTGRNPSRLALRKLPDSTVQITVAGDAGYDYGILISEDLANWNLWTNRVATNGTFSVVDPKRVDDWPYRRFYRAVLMQ
jgi:hypothetical protein